MGYKIEQLAINTIRTLSIDAIEQANSGHPGMPMGAAPMAYVLWSKIMNHNPQNPNWLNRDRFVLSAGHGSMLLYSLLHLFGYDVTLQDIKEFRQWKSKTPGHPEFGHTPGVEATTGPLGQGIAMAVGMAMAERHLAATYNRPNYNVIDHFTYSICGDGDLMEGVSAEAASLAGHLKLGRLIVMYDSNDISLDGELHLSFSEDVSARFKSYGWQVLRVEDGNDLIEIENALREAKSEQQKPTLIEVKTTIGFGSPNKAGKSDAHGAPLGSDEIRLTKAAYNWSYEKTFYVPKEVNEHFLTLKELGMNKEKEWNEMFSAYKEAHPELAIQLEDSLQGHLPKNWEQTLPIFTREDKLASRDASSEVINSVAAQIPYLIGGSADLASSNKTLIKEEDNFSAHNYTGRNIWFGVREFAMGAAVNGMVLHGGLKVYGATFFVFSDYLRPAIRLAALMKIPVIYVFTHDSIAVGEDGPTHEPVEQLASLRAMPGLSVIRPADGNETVAAWRLALESRNEPTALVFTRQALPTITNGGTETYECVKKGAYIISRSHSSQVEALLLASGSEVSIAIEAQARLEEEGIAVNVISMPSWDRFERQTEEYKREVLPPNVTARLAIEMGSSLGWNKYVGDQGDVLAIDQFGASAPGEKIIKEYGFTTENIVQRVKKLLKQ